MLPQPSAKILFVRMRKHYLAGESTLGIAAQANAVALFYALAIAAFAVVCFAAMLARAGKTIWGAAEFALFFFFSAINLAWFVLRNVSVAVDEYSYFETLEAARCQRSVCSSARTLSHDASCDDADPARSASDGGDQVGTELSAPAYRLLPRHRTALALQYSFDDGCGRRRIFVARGCGRVPSALRRHFRSRGCTLCHACGTRSAAGYRASVTCALV
jgi:hypothetical protein